MVRPRRSSLALCLHLGGFGLAPGGKKTSALLFVQTARKRSAKEGRETGRGVKETHPPCRGNWWLWGHAAVVAVVVEAGRVRSHPISSEGRGTATLEAKSEERGAAGLEHRRSSRAAGCRGWLPRLALLSRSCCCCCWQNVYVAAVGNAAVASRKGVTTTFLVARLLNSQTV